ncbi:MAG: 8-oxoguanine DNA glycosylase, N-terminal domain-containing protein, partial [Lachnospiraceae bacterium]|nr:8-oxoguanine DNA glycosylase, N-terminal domain-containing protein [Lachnospiraceae bacterium]
MFIINIPFMDLDQIYNSGQIFRWIKFRDGKYAIPHGDKCLKVEQQKDRFIMNCTDEDFYNIWYEYFDMNTDYMSLNYKSRGIDEDFKSKAVRASGVRILKQDLFEIIVSFILATATNIPNIKRMIEQIAVKCGKRHKQSMRECGQVKWYEFPTPEMILDKQYRLDDSFGLKRKENVIKFCKSI